MPRTMLFPARLTASAEAVRDAAQDRGMSTVVLPTFALPDGLVAEHLHAGPGFVDAVAPELGLAALETPVTWLADLPFEVVLRDVTAMPISEAWVLRTPAFIKTPNEKLIRAMAYADGSRLPGPDAMDPNRIVLVSDVVRFLEEVRLHVLDGAVYAASTYAVDGHLEIGPASTEAIAEGARLVAEVAHTIPSAVVIDIGRLDDGWAIIEANPAWASGIYATDPDRALEVILRSAGPADEVGDVDRPFASRGWIGA